MPKNTLTILGVLVAMLPFISVPGSMKTPLYVVFGVLVAFVSYRERTAKKRERRDFFSFTGRKVRKTIGQNTSHIASASPVVGEEMNKTDSPQTNEQTGDSTNQ